MAFDLSVIIATYNRTLGLSDLLNDLAAQQVDATFEVVVVDDGSKIPVKNLAADFPQLSLTCIRQDNAGPASARHHGIQKSSGAIVVLLDDDMRLNPDFLAAHWAEHQQGAQVVLGLIANASRLAQMPLFERFHAYQLNRFVQQVQKNTIQCSGIHVCSGNVSFTRTLYDAVGGLNPQLKRSEDRDLGLRFEQHGAKLVFCPLALSRHESDHTLLKVWLKRAGDYGYADTMIADCYPTILNSSPWSFYFAIHPVSRGVVLLPILLPQLAPLLATAIMQVSSVCDKLHQEKAAIAGTTLAYGVGYFGGVRRATGSLTATARALGQHAFKQARKHHVATAWRRAWRAVIADHQMMWHYEYKYHSKTAVVVTDVRQLAQDFIQKIGFQMIAMTRIMQGCRDARWPLLSKIVARFMRHGYSADIHWDAQIAPGVVIIHGIGLVISHAAKIDSGCILFHGVTLGEGIDAKTREIGAPYLQQNVHVGPHSTLIGPIVVGRDSKLAAGCVVSASLPAKSRMFAAASLAVQTDLAARS